MRHIHEHKRIDVAERQMYGIKKGDTVVVHRVDTSGKEEALVCVITSCANTLCINCAICGLWCRYYKGVEEPGIRFAFVPLEDAVE